MKPFRVLDTNVLVSAVLTPGGACDLLIHLAIERRFLPAWHDSLLAEYRNVLARPRFGLSPATRETLSELFTLEGCVDLAPLPASLPDPEGEPFLRTVLATPDKALVTGNLRHFPPEKRFGVAVLSSREAILRLTLAADS